MSWAAASSGASSACAASSSAEPALDLAVLLLDLRAPVPHRRLVGDLPVQRGAQGVQVVGEQPEPGVAQVGLDAGGPAGHLGLPAQRLELAAQLGGEVVEPVEVGLHRVELADRLLFALAVLEDAGRLLDERAAVLGLGVQHRVEPALADDDVHLAADAGVGEQLLDVEQAAGVAVDLVLALAGAEHPAGDRDLGVVDRQGAVAVVDRERHLGAAQRRPAGGAGEDDVLHLAAAQRLGALLAEHPGDGVDDVGLAGAVRAHHTGDARLQPQRRSGGEGLEALDRQALEVHGSPGVGGLSAAVQATCLVPGLPGTPRSRTGTAGQPAADAAGGIRRGKKMRAATVCGGALFEVRLWCGMNARSALAELRSAPARCSRRRSSASAACSRETIVLRPEAGDLELQSLHPGTQSGDLVEQAPVGRRTYVAVEGLRHFVSL